MPSWHWKKKTIFSLFPFCYKNYFFCFGRNCVPAPETWQFLLKCILQISERSLKYQRISVVRARKVRPVAASLLSITVRMISNCNRTEWGTIQGVIERVIWNYEHEYPWIMRHEVLLPINCVNNKMPERFLSQRSRKGGQDRRKTYLNKSHWTS